MKLENAGEQLIKSFETLELEAYPDPASPLGVEVRKIGRKMRHYREIPGWEHLSGAPWTIGWGHTGPEVSPGDVIDDARAQVLFEQDTERAEMCVTAECGALVNQNQFDALVSFAYNIGLQAFKDSTLLKLLHLHKFMQADAEFLKWNKAGGVVMLGLVRRRKAERELFITPFTGYTAP